MTPRRAAGALVKTSGSRADIKEDNRQPARKPKAAQGARARAPGSAAKRDLSSVAAGIASPLGPQGAIGTVVRAAIWRAIPGVEESIQWRHPFYRGQHLQDSQGRVEGTGKRMRHVKLRTPADVVAMPIGKWLREVMRLNRAAAQ